MDTPRGMNDQEADKALRALFQEAGSFTAPEGMEARILQRLAATPRSAPVPEKPLLPRWVWAFGAVLLAGVFIMSTRTSGPSSSWLHGLVPAGAIERVLGSPWLLMALASGTFLLALSTWLNTRLEASRPR